VPRALGERSLEALREKEKFGCSKKCNRVEDLKRSRASWEVGGGLKSGGLGRLALRYRPPLGKKGLSKGGFTSAWYRGCCLHVFDSGVSPCIRGRLEGRALSISGPQGGKGK